MKIKGVDLYKRLREQEDWSLLGKKFVNNELGEYEVTACGVYNNKLGLFRQGLNLFNGCYPSEIDRILLGEWEVVKERHIISWKELDSYITDDGFLSDDVKVEYKGLIYTPFTDVVGVSSIDTLGVNAESEDEFFSYDILINGEWFVEE